MNAAKDIAAAALTLPPRSRAALANSLLASLLPPQPTTRRRETLTATLQRRAAEITAGTAVTIPAEEAMRTLRRKLRKA